MLGIPDCTTEAGKAEVRAFMKASRHPTDVNGCKWRQLFARVDKLQHMVRQNEVEFDTEVRKETLEFLEENFDWRDIITAIYYIAKIQGIDWAVFRGVPGSNAFAAKYRQVLRMSV